MSKAGKKLTDRAPDLPVFDIQSEHSGIDYRGTSFRRGEDPMAANDWNKGYRSDWTG
jgi:hypothetical protein